MTHVRSRLELAALPVSAAVTKRGKELSAAATVGDARALFDNGSVQVVPVLSGATYVGAVSRDVLAADLDPATPVAGLASPLVPTALASSPGADAFAELDRAGATRLVVLDDDGVTYRGLVCLTSDRERACVDAECHTPGTSPPAKGSR